MFCIISFYFYQSKLGFCICFFNCQSCKCGQPSHNYIKRDLGNPNFSSTTIVIPLFSWTTSGVHIFTKVIEIEVTPQEPTSSNINTNSWENMLIYIDINTYTYSRKYCILIYLRKTQTKCVLRKWSTNTRTRKIYCSSKDHAVNINMTCTFFEVNFFWKETNNDKIWSI